MSEDNKGEDTAAPEVSEAVGDLPNLLTPSGLTAYLAQKEDAEAPQEDQQEPEEREEEAEEETEAEEEEEAQSTSEDETEADASESEDESDGNDTVLSERGKKQMLKRINKLTAQKKSAEERIDALETELARLSEEGTQDNNTQTQNAQVDLVEQAQSLQDLDRLKQEAQDAEDWALKHIAQESVTVGDAEYSQEDIQGILFNAKQTQRDAVKREKLLQEREQFDQMAKETFKDFQDPSTEASKFAQTQFSDPTLGPLLNKVPNRLMLIGLILAGLQTVNAKKEEPKPVKKKAKKAPKAPALDSEAPPPPKTGDAKRKDERDKLTSGNVDVHQLANFLADKT